ncbi:alpha-amylase family protein [Mucilaginibacter sp.]
MYKKIFCFCLLIGLIAGSKAFARVGYPGNQPGIASVKKIGNTVSLLDNALAMSFSTNGGKLNIVGFEDKQNHDNLPVGKNVLFSLSIAGEIINSNDFQLAGPVTIADIVGDKDAIKEANNLPGKKLTADLENKTLGLKIHWEASLLNGANYVRQIFTFIASDSIKIDKITLVQLPSFISIKKEGTVDGSPLVHNNMFFSLEHPMSQTDKGKSSYSIYLPRLNAVYNNAPLTISSVWGTTPAGQLRRGFLYYIERERAVPYRQFLHYNSWFDISWDDRKLNDSVCLDRINGFKDSLIDKRGVKLKAFLFDDGWDDTKTLWQFNSGFSKGFHKEAKAAKDANSTLGVWISPWGGYNEHQKQRLAYGAKQTPPFETNENGFSLTGPNYYKRFRSVTTSFIKDYNISIFKFDGVGAGNGASGASIKYQKDIEAFLNLLTELRSEKPDLYLSLTVGTWPSVYWLKYGDAIWRAGDDTGLDGEGPKRQQWITYKDEQAYKNVVKRAPLFPLNSIMYHGICIADLGLPGTLETDNKDISDEIWAFFGNGTSLQELYVNPHKLNSTDWDCIRDASSWSKAHAEQLADTHWVGGDPSKGEVYGYAGWSGEKGVLTLRNPTSHSKTFVVNVKKALDIPNGYSSNYVFYNAMIKTHTQLYNGETFTVKLAPFEVKVMNAKPL